MYDNSIQPAYLEAIGGTQRGSLNGSARRVAAYMMHRSPFAPLFSPSAVTFVALAMCGNPNQRAGFAQLL